MAEELEIGPIPVPVEVSGLCKEGWEIDGADAREAELRGEILARALAAQQRQ